MGRRREKPGSGAEPRRKIAFFSRSRAIQAPAICGIDAEWNSASIGGTLSFWGVRSRENRFRQSKCTGSGGVSARLQEE